MVVLRSVALDCRDIRQYRQSHPGNPDFPKNWPGRAGDTYTQQVISAPLEVEYVLTPEDLYAFQRRALQRSPIARRSRRNLYIGVFVALVILTIVPAIGSDGFVISRVSIGFLVIPIAVVASLTWLIEKPMTHKAIRQIVQQEKPEKGQLGRHTVKLEESAVAESTAVGEQRISWAGIDRIEHDPDYIYIYTTPMAAVVIPRRAFASPADAEEFHNLATARRNAAS